MKALLALMTLALLACGPEARSNGGGVDATPMGVDAHVPQARVTGIVFAPKNGPTQVAAGLEIPIAGALIYISDVKLPPIPDGVYCEKCIDTPTGGGLSNADGSFDIKVAPGDYWLTIQKGQFRLEQRVTVVDGDNPLLGTATTLPSMHNPAVGAWIPRIAVVQGTSDNIEDVLGKLGFGTMSGDAWSNPNGENGAEIAIYRYEGAADSAAKLFTDINELRKYHLIFFPCRPAMGNPFGSSVTYDAMLNDQAVLKNIRQYVAEGGKLYVTDWSGEIIDRAFPQQMQLGDDGADTVGTYNPTTLTGTITSSGDADGVRYSNNDGKAVQPDLAAWLSNQRAPTLSNPTPLPIDPNVFPIIDNYNVIAKTQAVLLGNDANGTPAYDDPTVWVTGTSPLVGQPKAQAVTFSPVGCGKVMYSTFQTSNAPHVGMFPQERILLYLIMDIQQCSTTVVVE